jgi:sugar phosphate isomerase/epimerase
MSTTGESDDHTQYREVQAADASPARGRPGIGCVSWCFHSLAGGFDPAEAIDTIGRLGFEGVELILQGRRDAEEFWTDEVIAATRRQLDEHGLAVPQFAVFQPVVAELTSTRADEREQALDRFEAGCRIARELGSPIVNIVAPWPRELSGPTDYLPRYFELADPAPGEAFHIDIAAGFDWQAVWAAFVESVKGCLQRAKAHGLRFTVENHTHTMVPDATAFLRLWDAVADPELGMNLDVGWTALQREYPPLAVHRAGPHLMNVHLRDIDGLMRRFVHVGRGVMDFAAIVQALEAVRFSGFVCLEQDGDPAEDMAATCARYVSIMRDLLT